MGETGQQAGHGDGGKHQASDQSDVAQTRQQTFEAKDDRD
jgi:hypothetical protein